MLHLLHPALVHFSVAFLVAGGVSEAWGIFRDRPRVERVGAALVVAGTLSLIPTVVTGFLAANTVDLPALAEGALALHERTGLALTAIFLLSQFWKAWGGGDLAAGHRKGYALLVLTGVFLVAATAWLGGEMVYGHGVGVRR